MNTRWLRRCSRLVVGGRSGSFQTLSFGHDAIPVLTLHWLLEPFRLARKGRELPGTRKRDLLAPANRIHAFVNVTSTLLSCHKKLKSFKYLTIQSLSMTVLIGASILYSKVNTSQPISPWEYSNIRASRRLSTYGGSSWAFELRIAVSRVAVRLCRKSVLAGRVRLGLVERNSNQERVPWQDKIHLP